MIKFIIFLLIIITPFSHDDFTAQLQPSDFSFKYNKVVVNSETPVEKIIEALGFGNRYIDNNYGLISSINGVNRRGIYHPEEDPDLFLVYIDHHDTYLVFADLIDVPTSRGITTGDSLEKLQRKYGEGTIKENHIEYRLDNKGLIFYFDEKTNVITRIIIDYNMERASVEQGIE